MYFEPLIKFVKAEAYIIVVTTPLRKLHVPKFNGFSIELWKLNVCIAFSSDLSYAPLNNNYNSNRLCKKWTASSDKSIDICVVPDKYVNHYLAFNIYVHWRCVLHLNPCISLFQYDRRPNDALPTLYYCAAYLTLFLRSTFTGYTHPTLK